MSLQCVMNYIWPSPLSSKHFTFFKVIQKHFMHTWSFHLSPPSHFFFLKNVTILNKNKNNNSINKRGFLWEVTKAPLIFWPVNKALQDWSVLRHVFWFLRKGCRHFCIVSVVCSAVRLKWFSFEWEGRGKRGGGMLIENLWLGDETLVIYIFSD